MVNRWGWRCALSPDDVFRRPWEWAAISSFEASSQSRSVPVIVVARTPSGEQAAWYDDHTTFFRGSGPTSHRAVRYYQYVGGVPQLAAAVHATAEERPSEPEPEPETIPERAPTEERTVWVEVQLLDSEGKPVANQKVHIELPDGSIAEPKTDAEGVVRLDSIDPGNCKFTFPDVDGRELKRI